MNEVDYTLPDGTVVKIPTPVAAMLAELGAAKQELAALKTAAAPPPAAAAPPPAAPTDAPVPGTPAATVAAAPTEAEKKEEGMDARVRARVELISQASKLAPAVGVDALHALDDDAIRRKVLESILPALKTAALAGDALVAVFDSLTAVAAAPPTPAAPATHTPWSPGPPNPRPLTGAPRTPLAASADAASAAQAAYLRKQGVIRN